MMNYSWDMRIKMKFGSDQFWLSILAAILWYGAASLVDIFHLNDTVFMTLLSPLYGMGVAVVALYLPALPSAAIRQRLFGPDHQAPPSSRNLAPFLLACSLGAVVNMRLEMLGVDLDLYEQGRHLITGISFLLFSFAWPRHLLRG